jgi:TRAP-type C4-dicarboxylate transport system permease small subunit
MQKYHEFVLNMTRKLDFWSGISLALMMIIITVNVILRKLDITFGQAPEYVQFLMAMCVGLGVAHCAVCKGHIEISMFVDKMPERLRRFFEVLVNAAILIFVASASYFLADYGVGYIKAGTVGMISRMPLYPFVWITSLGFFMYCFVAIDNIIQAAFGNDVKLQQNMTK